MLNPAENYTAAGKGSAIARNQRDEARARHWAEYFRAMRGYEKGDDRQTADKLYHDAYTEARNV
jgi:hypothetical protein